MLPSRRSLLALALVPLPAAAADIVQLVTPEEAEAGRGPDQPRPLTRSIPVPDPPVIEVVEPREAPTLPSPLTIRLSFRSPTGTAINPTSFRASYGALGLDITDRLMQRARVDANGLVMENVAIPEGSHRITLRVADAVGRIGERAFRFTIAAR
jgi:hypothetical protein